MEDNVDSFGSSELDIHAPLTKEQFDNLDEILRIKNNGRYISDEVLKKGLDDVMKNDFASVFKEYGTNGSD